MSPRLLSLLCVAAAACSSGGAIAPGPADLSGGAASGDLAAAAAPDLSAALADLSSPRDLVPAADLVVSADDCLVNWRQYNDACPAPTITASYVANGCVGTSGWFVDGTNFQLEQRNVGIADYGPQSFGANGDQRHWNIITTTRLCVTVSAAAKAAWVGHTIYVKNPDGKASNSVLVTDRL